MERKPGYMDGTGWTMGCWGVALPPKMLLNRANILFSLCSSLSAASASRLALCSSRRMSVLFKSSPCSANLLKVVDTSFSALSALVSFLFLARDGPGADC